jgi:hypothetical protein
MVEVERPAIGVLEWQKQRRRIRKKVRSERNEIVMMAAVAET